MLEAMQSSLPVRADRVGAAARRGNSLAQLCQLVRVSGTRCGFCAAQ